MPERPGHIDLPPHAYVPGQTPRHPEDLFDPVKASVTGEVPVAELHRTEAWRAGRAYFEAGYYWECHEVLEAVWMRTPEGSQERDITQALIQLANARLKITMRRPRAAWRLCNMVAGHLARCDADALILGLRVPELRELVAQTRRSLERQGNAI
ncbi:hypothetical protein FIU94_07765 [Sulfitobacter sp. THAF37]|uniref:DUF309 domain-containing protein n=1 Tax=Sulfitobacter sp. THAF37 TaxID=2587855 RepID=UPI0012A7CB26|nr:DUF309 domain-containing protein [Sulfitobacter sp. THAF37]QFT58718.1 hypothetical protein FIU94_07765 [Sulfitobacter sp. THAF37]